MIHRFMATSILTAMIVFWAHGHEPIVFPKNFLKGIASSTYQNSGHNYWPSLGKKAESNWTWFENEHQQRFRIDRRKSFFDMLQKVSPIDYRQKVGISADTWTHMFDDIALIKELKVNAFRFELPWADLNPEPGVWNEEGFALFDRYIDALKAQGIEPMITLYHWVHPRWFHEKGGWEKRENIEHFVAYCKEAFRRYGHKVRYWLTINEPTVISACGYILGSHAPGIQNDWRMAGTVLGHLLKGHIRAYDALKKMPNGSLAQISLVHQMAIFEPYAYSFRSPLSLLSKTMAKHFSHIFANDVVLNFFKTGHFRYLVSSDVELVFNDKRALDSLDFIGLNFYSSITMGPGPTCYSGEVMTDMIWPVRPQAIYEAIKQISQLGKPIIITENGIPDAKDDRREGWIIGYTRAIKQAINDGYDVRGYFYWSLLDNFEWNMGHDKKFGLYAVDTQSSDPKEKARVLRKGAHAFRDLVCFIKQEGHHEKTDTHCDAFCYMHN